MSNEDNDLKSVTDERGLVRVVVELKKPRSFAAAADMETTKTYVPGLELDLDFGAIPISSNSSNDSMLDSNTEDIVLVRGKIEEKGIKQLEKEPNVLKVWRDTAGIRPSKENRFSKQFVRVAASTTSCPDPSFSTPCDLRPDIPKGSILDVAEYLGVTSIWSNGNKGKGIVVAVQDGGITAQGREIKAKDINHIDPDTGKPDWPGKIIENVIYGSNPDWGTTGYDWGWHGNMCATDVLGMAPEAKIYDLRINSNTLSSALQNFQWAIDRHRKDGTPHIITNSWNYYQKAWDPDYATNPDHFLTRKIIEAVNEGIIVLFSAGNCGAMSGDPRCNADTGTGKSIWGANGHEKVITVAAVNKEENYISYSSVGPAALHQNKPDIASISHFTGFFHSDNGTSAATPIAAGVAALLKEARPALTPVQIKEALMSTCKDIGPQGNDIYTGSGIIQAKAAHEYVMKL